MVLSKKAGKMRKLVSRKSHAHNSQHPWPSLPSTPKGASLSDHYGAIPEASPYGPQPTLIKKHVKVYDSKGNLEKENDVYKVIHLSTPPTKCDMAKMDNFEICLSLTDCDVCSAAPHCGWCEISKRCYPGNLKASACPSGCVNGWVFNKESCRKVVRSGAFSNMDPQATSINSIKIADLAQPKIVVNTVVTHPAVVTTPVLLGQRTEV
jgi:hypothetical protein